MAISKVWPNRATFECYNYLDSTGDIYNIYIAFVVDYNYGVYELTKRIRDDIDIKISTAIQTVDNDFIATLLHVIYYEIDFVEIATEIFHQAQNYI